MMPRTKTVFEIEQDQCKYSGAIYLLIQSKTEFTFSTTLYSTRSAISQNIPSECDYQAKYTPFLFLCIWFLLSCFYFVVLTLFFSLYAASCTFSSHFSKLSTDFCFRLLYYAISYSFVSSRIGNFCHLSICPALNNCQLINKYPIAYINFQIRLLSLSLSNSMLKSRNIISAGFWQPIKKDTCYKYLLQNSM